MLSELYLALYIFCLYMGIYYLRLMKHIQPTRYEEKEETQETQETQETDELHDIEEEEEVEEVEEEEEKKEEEEPSPIAAQ